MCHFTLKVGLNLVCSLSAGLRRSRVKFKEVCVSQKEYLPQKYKAELSFSNNLLTCSEVPPRLVYYWDRV